jgi:hypothetical protein
MMLIGIDPQKSTHTATAIAPDANHEVASIRIETTLGEYRRIAGLVVGLTEERRPPGLALVELADRGPLLAARTRSGQRHLCQRRPHESANAIPAVPARAQI